MPSPSYVQMEPVGQCNLRCQMCPILYRKDGPPYGPPAFMKFEDFTRLVGEFENLKHLHLQGLGEPMMHPRFFDMVAYAAAKGIRVTTNTNLTLLNQRRAELAVTCGLDCIHVSVDGATPETYERIRKRSRFAKVVGNIELLLDARRRHNATKPDLNLVMVVMRQNLHELADLVRRAAQWTIRAMFVQHLCHDFTEETLPEIYRPMREFVEQQTLVTEDAGRIEKYFSEARRVAAECAVDLRLPNTRPRAHAPGTPGRQRCDWPWTGAYISYDGKAMPCCMVATPDRSNFGSMAVQGVTKIWSSEEFQRFRAQLASDTPPAICASCSVYKGVF